MHKSHYFEELSASYSAEIDDLVSDSEGKSVLTARLKEKRRELDALLQMIEFAPEMVVPVFFGAFSFHVPEVISQALQSEPDDDDFPAWDAIADTISLTDWASPLVTQTLAVDGGERFIVTAAALEFLRIHGTTAVNVARESEEENDNNKEFSDDDDENRDLGEAGADWLSEQGFDSHSS